MRLWGLLLSICVLGSACAGQTDAADKELARELAGPASVDEPSSNADDTGTQDETAVGAGDQDGEAPNGTTASTSSNDDRDQLSSDATDTDTEGSEAEADIDGGIETSDDVEADSPNGADTEDEGAAAPTANQAPANEFDGVVDELIAFVEDQRGHSFTSRPEIELLDNERFGQAWLEVVAADVRENPADYVNYTDIYRAMGVIDGDRSLEQIWERFGDAGVLGYYDPSTGGIVLRNGEVNAFTRTVLVHELVHALEDQVFGLDRPQYANENSEREWTFSALAEGSARRIETIYRAAYSDAERAEEVAARQAIPRTVSLAEFNTSFLELQFGRYRHGEEFATTLWNQGADTLDAAFAQPPATSEAILDPAFYLRSGETGQVASPPADGEVFESGVWGEAAWAAVFADIAAVADAEVIADGWNGDAFVAYRNGSITCVRIHLAADSPGELDEYAENLEAWASLDAGRKVFYPTADLIRVTACG